MNNLEQEIADLQKMIEAKRDQLEKDGGIVEEKELVRQSVKEMFLDASSPKAGQTAQVQTDATQNQATASATAKAQVVSASDSYLDHLDDQTAEMINHLVAEIPTKGIASVINEASGQEPFIIDAFHDALVDKLYDELKARGIVK